MSVSFDPAPAARGLLFGAFLASLVGSPGRSAALDVLPFADLSLGMSAPANAFIGSTISFTLTVTNLGPGGATGVVVTDGLPPEVTFRACSATGGGICGGTGNARTITFPGLAAGASAEITLDVDVTCSTPPGTVLVNTASVAATFPPDPDPSNNTATAKVTLLFMPPPPPPPLMIEAPEAVQASTPDWVASLKFPFGSAFVWTISNGTITSGQGTPQITFTSGAPGVLDLGVTESNPPACYSFHGSALVRVVPAPSAALFYPVTGCRLVDTREPDGPLGGPALAPSSDRSFPAAGACGIPAGATSIAVNVTVANTAAAGTLQAYPGDSAPRSATTISFGASQTRSNNAILLLSTDGSGTVGIRNTAAGTVDLVIDVSGYFQ